MNLAAAAMLAKSGEAAKSGPIGLAVILILCIACYFLFKSMSKHLKTVRENFPTGAGANDPGAAQRVTDPEPPATQAPVAQPPAATERPPASEPPAAGQPGEAPCADA